MESFFKQIDIYGEEIKLNFQQKNRFNTVFGGAISLGIFCLFFIGCWFFGKELIYKQSPSVISSERPVDSPQRIDVRPDNLILMMGVSNFQGQYFTDPTVFQVRAIQQQQIKQYNETIGKDQIQLVNIPKRVKICDQNDVQIPSLKNYFSTINLNTQYCFDNSEDEVYFEGDFNQKVYSQLFVYFEKCKNSTSHIICKPPEEIDKILINNRISLFASDHFINPLDFHNPISDRGINLVSFTSSQFPQQATFYYTNYYIQTDAGAFYEELQTKHSFMFASQVVSPFFGDPNVIIAMNFRMQKQKEGYMQRKYLKIADIVAQIGGLLKILIVFGAIICNPISKLYYLKAIVDQVYQFKTKEQEEENNNQKKSTIKTKKKNTRSPSPKNKLENDQSIQQLELAPIRESIKIKRLESRKEEGSQLKKNLQESPLTKKQKQVQINLNQQNANLENILTLNQSQLNKKNFIDQILFAAKSYFQSTHNTIKYKFRNYFAHAFFPKFKFISHRRNLLDKGIAKIQENFDILYIFNKLLEIDKLKQILLNDDQLKVFKYIPKPYIEDEDQQTMLDNKQNASNLNFNKSGSPKILIQQSVIQKSNEQQLDKSQKQNNHNPYEIQQQQQQQQHDFQSQSNSQLEESETFIAQEAFIGLKNILGQSKLSKVDENLIKIINPAIVQEYKNSFTDKNNYKQNSIQNLDTQSNLLKTLQENKYINAIPTNKVQSSNYNDKNRSFQFELTEQNKIYNSINLDKKNQKEETSQQSSVFDENQLYFINQDDLSYQHYIQSPKIATLKTLFSPKMASNNTEI